MVKINTLNKISLEYQGVIKSNSSESSEPLVLDFRQVTLLTGLNGTGKSLVSIHIWIHSWVLQVINVLQKSYTDVLNKSLSGALFVNDKYLEAFQTIYNGSFNDLSSLNGYSLSTFSLKGTHDDLELRIFVKKGIVTEIMLSSKDEIDLESVPVVRYLSTNTRKFDDFDKFIKLSSTFTDEQMSEFYKIYDLVFFNELKYKLSESVTLDIENDLRITSSARSDNFSCAILKGVNPNFNESVNNFELLIENNHCYIKVGEIKKLMSSLSAGEQAWAMMNWSIAIFNK